ncbi:MAG: helix-turn-helix domain-containing protein [Clostridia bacterium]|nr:helix-turn-helix domain-containing protein [Clostridia bacterium]
MSFSQKVTRLLRENGMSKAALAKDAGIPYTTLDSMLKRETDTARLTTVFRIADALGTSVRSLVFDGDEEKEALSSEEKRILELYSLLDDRGRNTVLSLLEKEADNSKPAAETRSFPIYDAPAAAGEPMPVLTEEKREEICHVHAIPKGAEFGIRLSGDSMEPLFSDGDLVYVAPGESLGAGEIGVFLLNGESLCKKLLKIDGETYLVSLNPKYEPIRVLETDELKLVGRVIVE